jgi:RNA polymerase subunit RPABC4/transcription elongation factor Spt4
MLGAKKEKIYFCPACGFRFSNLNVPRTCSNCFACTGCEIYICPACGSEVVIKPIKPMKKQSEN